MALPLSQENEMSFDQYKERGPLQISSFDTARASYNLSEQGTALGIYNRAKAFDTADVGRVLSPEQANAQYPEMPTKWKEPVKANVAQMLSDQHRENAQFQEMIDRGPQDFYAKAKNFGAGLLAHAMDPVELGTAMLAGWGAGAVLTRTALGAAAAESLAMSAAVPGSSEAVALAARGVSRATFATRLGFHTAEAVSGNFAQMSALEGAGFAQSKRENQPVDPYEGMQNVIANTFFGSLFHVGIKELSFGAKRAYLRFLKNTSPEADLGLARGVVSQVERSVKPNVEPLVSALANETNVKGDVPFEPLDTTKPNPDQKFYIASGDGTIDPSAVRPIGEDFGGDLRVTDNPNVANAAAARSMADSPGHVVEVSLKDLNALDLNETLPKEAIASFETAMDGVVRKEDISMLSPREMIQTLWNEIDHGNVPPERLTKLHEDLKAAGYNALLDDGKSLYGYEHEPHNNLTILDHSIIEQKGATPADPSIRNDISPEIAKQEITRQQDPGQKMGMDQKLIDDFNKSLEQADHEGTSKIDNLQIDEKVQAQREYLEGLDKQGLLDAYDKQELEILKQMEKEPELMKTAAKALAGCILKHG